MADLAFRSFFALFRGPRGLRGCSGGLIATVVVRSGLASSFFLLPNLAAAALDSRHRIPIRTHHARLVGRRWLPRWFCGEPAGTGVWACGCAGVRVCGCAGLLLGGLYTVYGTARYDFETHAGSLFLITAHIPISGCIGLPRCGGKPHVETFTLGRCFFPIFFPLWLPSVLLSHLHALQTCKQRELTQLGSASCQIPRTC